MNPIDELKHLRPDVDPLTDDVRRSMRRDLFDGGVEQGQEHRTDDLSVVDIEARRGRAVRTPRRAVASAAAVAALVLAVGLSVAAESKNDDVVANGLAGNDSSTANGNGEPWTPPRVAPSPPELPRVGAHAWRPLLAFLYTESDNERMYTQWQRRIAECMDDAGFSYTPVEYVPDTLGSISPLDRSAAEALGYHEPADGVEHPAPPTSPEAVDSLARCANASMEATFGSVEQFSMGVDAALQQFDAAVNGWADTEEGQVTLGEWSACMADKGYDYGTPDDAQVVFEDEPVLTEEEVATRLAHFDCDIRVGLTETRSAYEESAALQWISEHQGLIADLVDRKTEYNDALDRLESQE